MYYEANESFPKQEQHTFENMDFSEYDDFVLSLDDNYASSKSDDSSNSGTNKNNLIKKC